MRVLRFSTLVALATLTACAQRKVPIAAVPPPPAPQRALVETPPPATIAEPPLPKLRPGTELTPAEADAYYQQASPKGPPVEPGPGPSSEEGAGLPPPGAEAVATPGAAPPPAEPGVVDAQHLVGLSQADATKMFGSPAERKDVPPAQVWTYRSETCDLKLYFYPEVGGSAFRALTYQIDDRGANDATHHACLASLAKPHDG